MCGTSHYQGNERGNWIGFINPKKFFTRSCPGGADGVEYIAHCFTGEVQGQIATKEKGVVAIVSEQTLLNGPFGVYNGALFEALREQPQTIWKSE